MVAPWIKRRRKAAAAKPAAPVKAPVVKEAAVKPVAEKAPPAPSVGKPRPAPAKRRGQRSTRKTAPSSKE